MFFYFFGRISFSSIDLSFKNSKGTPSHRRRIPSILGISFVWFFFFNLIMLCFTVCWMLHNVLSVFLQYVCYFYIFWSHEKRNCLTAEDKLLKWLPAEFWHKNQQNQSKTNQKDLTNWKWLNQSQIFWHSFCLIHLGRCNLKCEVHEY